MSLNNDELDDHEPSLITDRKPHKPSVSNTLSMTCTSQPPQCRAGTAEGRSAAPWPSCALRICRRAATWRWNCCSIWAERCCARVVMVNLGGGPLGCRIWGWRFPGSRCNRAQHGECSGTKEATKTKGDPAEPPAV